MASGATTCYKMKTCSEGGYFDSVPADQKCSSKSYNGYSCYTGCSYKTCSDYGYNSSIPSGKTCETVHPRSGLTCYKDCKDDYFTATIELCVDIKNKNTQESLPTFCGFNNLVVFDGNHQWLINVEGTENDSVNHLPQMNCQSKELTFNASEDPIIIFEYLPRQSTWTCGYYTTQCDETTGTTLSTTGLKQLSATTRGAYIDYKYQIMGNANITVIYQCLGNGNPYQLSYFLLLL